jgi:hypothetical protein
MSGAIARWRDRPVVRREDTMTKRYTFVTTYIVEADDEATATKTRVGLEAWLGVDVRVAEYWTKLTDIEDK